MATLTLSTTNASTDADLYSFGYFDAAIGYHTPQRTEPAYVKGFESFLMDTYGAPF